MRRWIYKNYPIPRDEQDANQMSITLGSETFLFFGTIHSTCY
ncbi:MAG: hypothetical protein WC525_09645 [Candidatus Thermoplasmatota archaeon]